MKLTVLLLTVACLNLSAKVVSQTITYSAKASSLEKIFKVIKKQTGYLVICNYELIRDSKPVSIDAQRMPVEKFINETLKTQELDYTIKDKTIVISRKKNLLTAIVDPFVAEKLKQIISGIIKDESGQPMEGVNVKVKGSDVTTQTDGEGRFSLNADMGQTLVISYVGFQEREIKISQAIISVSLKILDKSLSDIVVLGYGTVRKRDMTGSSSNVSAATINETPPTTLENALQGRMAGVNVTTTSAEPGGGINILIRGATSLAGGNQPLYVIDGVPQYNDYSRSPKEINGNVPANALATLNPSDVESVEVLKDASSVAIYGSRGANGVILITTKRGKVGKPVTAFIYNATLAERPKYIPLANAREGAEFMNLVSSNIGEIAPFTGVYKKTTDGLDSLYYPRPDELGEGTNWQKEIFRSAITHNYQLTVSGGTDAVKYLISGNYLRDQGVVKNTQYQKGSIRANIDAKLNKRFSARLVINMAADQNDRAESTNTITTPVGFAMSGVIQKSFLAQPFLDKNNNAYELFLRFPTRPGFVYGLINPLNDLLFTINQRKVKYQQSNLDLVYNFTNELSLTVRGGYNTTANHTDMFWGLKTELGYDRQQKTYLSTWETESYVNENYLSYNKTTDNFNLNVVAGTSVQSENARGTVLGGELLTVPTSNGIDLLPLYANRSIPVTDRVKSFLVSGFGRVSFSYKNRYLLSLSGRSDASSKFAENNKWAFFPAYGVGWNFTEEKFLSGLQSVLSNGKLRFSYGVTGNQAISPYQSLSALSAISYGFIGGIVTGVATSTAENKDLKWETTKQSDFGVDLSFKNNKYRVSFDVYKKVTDDLLQRKDIPSESGYTTFLSNFGSIENKGVEFEFFSSMIHQGNFGWDLSFNISSNKNKILDLGEGVKFYNATSGQTDYTHRLRVGGSLGDFWGYQTAGLLTAKDITDHYPTLQGSLNEGDLKIRDIDTNRIINDADKIFLGNAFPKASLGFSNNFTFKNWTLNIFLVGVLGHKIMNQNLQYFEYGVPFGNPSKKYLSDYWTPDNTDAYYPRPSASAAREFSSDRLIEDGSSVRIKTLSLRYNFLNIAKWVSKAQVYVTANNLYTFTNYSGYDPEVSGYGQNILTPGIDVGSYPRTRMWTLGIDLQF